MIALVSMTKGFYKASMFRYYLASLHTGYRYRPFFQLVSDACFLHEPSESRQKASWKGKSKKLLFNSIENSISNSHIPTSAELHSFKFHFELSNFSFFPTTCIQQNSGGSNVVVSDFFFQLEGC